MNAKTAKRIRKAVLSVNGLEKTVTTPDGKTVVNPMVNRILRGVKKEYNSLPKNKREAFKAELGS